MFTPIVLLGWYLAPLFLPVWRWQNLSDWDAVANAVQRPKAKVMTVYDVTLRYAPRSSSDPMPFQLMACEPVYDPEAEEKTLVRVTAISDRSGEPPGSLRIGSSGHFSDNYFKAKAWILPPGAFQQNRHRPVVIYDASTLDKLAKPVAEGLESELREARWANDDETVDDGAHQPAQKMAQ